MTRNIIEDENGKKYVELKDGDVITSKKQRKGYTKAKDDEEAYNESKNQYGEFYFKQHHKQKKFEIDDSDCSDLARLMYSLTYMDYDNILKTDKGAYMNKSMLFKTIDVDRKIFNSWYNKMVERGIFMNIDDTYIAIITDEYIKGNLPKVKNSYYTKLYNDTIRDIYESNKGKNMSALGLIFRMIPYIHSKVNIVCKNPTCKNIDKINPVTSGEIAKELGYGDKVSQMQKMLSKFVLSNGEPIMLFVTNGNKMDDTVMINPVLMFKGNSKELHLIHAVFRSHVAKSMLIDKK